MTTDFGTDLSLVTDLTPDCASVSGQRLVAEAIVRRWSTPRGRLIDDPDYGFDLPGYLNDDIDAAGLLILQSGLEGEALKDERVLACTVLATLDTAGLLTVTANVDTAAGPFQLVLGVSDVTVELLAVT